MCCRRQELMSASRNSEAETTVRQRCAPPIKSLGRSRPGRAGSPKEYMARSCTFSARRPSLRAGR